MYNMTFDSENLHMTSSKYLNIDMIAVPLSNNIIQGLFKWNLCYI